MTHTPQDECREAYEAAIRRENAPTEWSHAANYWMFQSGAAWQQSRSTDNAAIEKVAEALFNNSQKRNTGEDCNGLYEVMSQNDGIRDVWESLAKAAITAMNNPASLSTDAASKHCVEDAQIASMGLHAAPRDAVDGGDTGDAGGTCTVDGFDSCPSPTPQDVAALVEEIAMLRKVMHLVAMDNVFLSTGDNGPFLISFPHTWHNREKLQFYANCNDTFGYASADAEEMTLKEAAVVYDKTVSEPQIEPWIHLALWSQEKRGGAEKSPFIAPVKKIIDKALAGETK